MGLTLVIFKSNFTLATFYWKHITFKNKKTTRISLIHQFSSFCTGSKPATNSRQFIDTQARITTADKGLHYRWSAGFIPRPPPKLPVLLTNDASPQRSDYPLSQTLYHCVLSRFYSKKSGYQFFLYTQHTVQSVTILPSNRIQWKKT